jgi:hypothetical protein
MSDPMSHDHDDRMVSPAELVKYPAPPRTATYTPVAHTDVLDVVLNRARCAGLRPADDEFVGLILAKNGRRMFGTARYIHTVEGRVITLGFRNSYDKSTSIGIATGQTVMVCSNMMFSGRDATFMRRHTGNALVEFGERVAKALAKSRVEAAALDRDVAALTAKACSLDDGYGVMGRALGHRITTPTQTNEAMRAWREPRHEAHQTRNGWALYNAFTQGLKHGEMELARYAKVHRFLLAEAGLRQAA